MLTAARRGRRPAVAGLRRRRRRLLDQAVRSARAARAHPALLRRAGTRTARRSRSSSPTALDLRAHEAWRGPMLSLTRTEFRCSSCSCRHPPRCSRARPSSRASLMTSARAPTRRRLHGLPARKTEVGDEPSLLHTVAAAVLRRRHDFRPRITIASAAARRDPPWCSRRSYSLLPRASPASQVKHATARTRACTQRACLRALDANILGGEMPRSRRASHTSFLTPPRPAPTRCAATSRWSTPGTIVVRLRPKRVAAGRTPAPRSCSQRTFGQGRSFRDATVKDPSARARLASRQRAGRCSSPTAHRSRQPALRACA